MEESYYDTVPLENGTLKSNGSADRTETELNEDARIVLQYHYTSWSDYRLVLLVLTN